MTQKKAKKKRLNVVQAIQSPSNDNAKSAHATDRQPLAETMYGKCRNRSESERDATKYEMK